jgi:hypothetical protein
LPVPEVIAQGATGPNLVLTRMKARLEWTRAACCARAWCDGLLNQCWISAVPESDGLCACLLAGQHPVSGKPKDRRRAPTLNRGSGSSSTRRWWTALVFSSGSGFCNLCGNSVLGCVAPVFRRACCCSYSGEPAGSRRYKTSQIRLLTQTLGSVDARSFHR